MIAASSTAAIGPQNKILKALPVNEFRQLGPHIKRVELPAGDVLHEVGEPIENIYFPDNAIVSSVSFFEDGASIESGIAGSEGMTGVSVALSGEVSTRETSVQQAGMGWKIPTVVFRSAFERGGAFQHLVLRYVNVFHEQVAQSGACINHHPINQRLARWLLMCQDRAEGAGLRITHDLMAQMLGANRPSVTGAAIKLKEGGFIKYSRGVVEIIDRRGLENFTCECYGLIKSAYDQYESLLELREMNYRLDQLNGQMQREIERRKGIQAVTEQRVDRLRQIVAARDNLPAQRVYVCRKCQRLCDARRNATGADQYVGKRFNAEFNYVVCKACAAGGGR